MTPRLDIDRATARRFLVARHLLAPPRALPADPASVLRVMDRLGSLQFDPLEVTGRNHDLVLAARIDGYRRAWTDDHLYGSRDLYETYNKGLSIVPTAELPWYRIAWDRAAARHDGDGAAFDEHGPLAEELLGRIRDEGPLASTDVEPRAAIDWYWRPTNQVRALLEALAEAGILGLARRDGNRRVYDLAERLFPAELLATAAARARAAAAQAAVALPGPRSPRALGEWRAVVRHGAGTGRRHVGGPTRRDLLEGLIEDGTLIPVVVEGVRGDRFVLADEAADPGRRGRGAHRSPERASRSSRRSTPSSGTATCCARCSTSTTSGRSTSRPRSDAGATTSCRSCSATASSGRIEPRIDRRTRTLRVLDLWWEAGFEPMTRRLVSPPHSRTPLEAHARFLDGGSDRAAADGPPSGAHGGGADPTGTGRPPAPERP